MSDVGLTHVALPVSNLERSIEFYAGENPTILEELPERGIRAIGQPAYLDNILIQCTKISDDIAKFDSVMPSLRDVSGD